MAKLSEFRANTRALEDGVWIRVDEMRYGDLEILSRGYTDEFVDAQNARMKRAAEAFGGDRERIPNAELRSINASLLEDFLVIDVRNLEDDDGKQVDKQAFCEMLYRPEYNRLSRACWEAATRVTTGTAAQQQAGAKNLPKRSEPGSIGANSDVG